jgi:hypothetical protein
VKTPAKPEARIVSEVCSLCGIDWHLHGPEPTTDTCISLLAAEVARLRAQLAARPIGYPLPYPVPAVPPWRPWGPYWQTTWNTVSGPRTPMFAPNTPTSGNWTPRPVAALGQ